ncbi:hypothetical protein DL96DRAFT_1820632 [Flagelloscypha sp. PMI_526]|nr:hypothetical protein DL96DRAFT_1820632 [Flagelloscypha sp. PMI_526]
MPNVRKLKQVSRWLLQAWSPNSYAQPVPILPLTTRSAGHTTAPVKQTNSNPKPHLRDNLPMLYPMLPGEIKRYQCQAATGESKGIHIDARVTNIDVLFEMNAWSRFVTAEGYPYYRHKDGIYTDAPIDNEKVRSKMDETVNGLNNYLHTHAENLFANDFEIVLKNITGDAYGYYLVSHNTRSVFWLDKFHIPADFNTVPGIHDCQQFKYELQSQYWHHCEIFPFHNIPIVVREELKEILIHGIGVNLTSQTSTMPYSTPEMEQMLHLVQAVTAESSPCIEGDGSKSMIARLMCIFAHHKHLQYYGQPFVRLNAYESKCSKIRNTTRMFKFISFILFGCPQDFYERLEKVTVDGIIVHIQWSKFIELMASEWRDLLIYAALFLNVNIAFLSIDTVDRSRSQNGLDHSAAKLLSYTSAFLSVGAILVGLILLRQTRIYAKCTSSEAGEFIKNNTYASMGFEPLMIIYSIPYGFTFWGIISFLAALANMCLSGGWRITWSMLAILQSGIFLSVIFVVGTQWPKLSTFWTPRS